MKIDELSYWDTRYKKGGNSGAGSIGQYRNQKWDIIESFVGDVNDVIDVGCGDLSFWEGKDCVSYLGIDRSPKIININRIARPHWKFINADAAETQSIQARIVFCFDILFHIMNDGIYCDILSNLTKYSNEWIFIFTWKENPFISWKLRSRIFYYRLIEGKIFQAVKMLMGSTTDFHYQTYRNLIDSISIFQIAGFELQAEIGGFPDPWSAMFVFKKKIP